MTEHNDATFWEAVARRLAAAAAEGDRDWHDVSEGMRQAKIDGYLSYAVLKVSAEQRASA